MAIINLGNVVGLLKQLTPPASKPYVLWGKILNPAFPDVVQVRQYSGSGDPALEANWDPVAANGYWVEKPSASGNIEYISGEVTVGNAVTDRKFETFGNLKNTRTETGQALGADLDILLSSNSTAMSLGVLGAGVNATQPDFLSSDSITSQIGVGALGAFNQAVLSTYNNVTTETVVVKTLRDTILLEYRDTYSAPTFVNNVRIDNSGHLVNYNDAQGGNPYPYRVASTLLSTGSIIKGDMANNVVLGEVNKSIGFFAAGGSTQGSLTSLPAGTAGGAYTATEQTMLQNVHDRLVTLMAIIDSYNLIKIV